MKTSTLIIGIGIVDLAMSVVFKDSFAVGLSIQVIGFGMIYRDTDKHIAKLETEMVRRAMRGTRGNNSSKQL